LWWSACAIRIAERADHVTAKLQKARKKLQKPRAGEHNSSLPTEKIKLFSLTVKGLANKHKTSADLSEQLAGA
jgi:hypothetical protein